MVLGSPFHFYSQAQYFKSNRSSLFPSSIPADLNLSPPLSAAAAHTSTTASLTSSRHSIFRIKLLFTLFVGFKSGGGFTSSSLRASFSYCVQQVRSYDYHHYLCLLELPLNMRKAAFAIRAFNIETARAMDVASDPKIGLMRLLWWQEAIDKIYAKKAIEHPTAQALSSVIHENKITKGWLKRSVEARINDARRESNEIPEKIKELEQYAEDTASTILYTTLQAGGIRSTIADHAASHVGKASGLLLLIKSLPYHASRNRHFSYIPTEVAAKHGLLSKQGGQIELHLDSRENLCSAVFDMASIANVHLQKARELAGKVPAEARPVLLPAVPAQVLLDSLSQAHFDVFDPRLSRGVLGLPPLWFQVKLKWHSWRGKY
ncbi:hypothetical protein F8388_001921 [Cannabis sativa]|uniref:NADH dehydrogenase (Ubiquinone) complex I, assembly factor 6 n=2 Tax=Cannabis sativa TaxID=3483 RepID=A0A7J6ERZ1_CANSA|nr:hypothetical protein F8388_001921 [Cannabis sativa]